jgi:hypothetical protein
MPFLVRAATILHNRKRLAEAMWGRLITCGGLEFRLPQGPPLLKLSPKTPLFNQSVGMPIAQTSSAVADKTH